MIRGKLETTHDYIEIWRQVSKKERKKVSSSCLQIVSYFILRNKDQNDAQFVGDSSKCRNDKNIDYIHKENESDNKVNMIIYTDLSRYGK